MKTKEDLWQAFDPNGPSSNDRLFGLPYSSENADIILLPVPWEVTVSYREGTSRAPAAVIKASSQIDLFSETIPQVWKLAVAVVQDTAEIIHQADSLRELAKAHIESLESAQAESSQQSVTVTKVNEGSENLNIYVKALSQRYLREGKVVGLLGGDHSIPLGLLRALAEKHNRFGILQIDAHADLRKSYEGFMYSHASIMFNALKLPAVGRLVNVGLRDYCEEEHSVIERSMGRIKCFTNRQIANRLFEGATWKSICDEIVKELPALVYISFDIDGLDPSLCPGTGTPVPGGLTFDQVTLLLQTVVKSGRKIIGFDLVETGNQEWDAIVGARILWELCLNCGVSNNLITSQSS